MKPLSERIKGFPTDQFVDWLCLACVDVRELRTLEDAQNQINEIRDVVTERLSALEKRIKAAEAKLALVREQRDSELNRNTELEAQLAALAKQDPMAYIIQDAESRSRGRPGFLSYDGSISDEDINEYEISVTPLFARPAPPAPVKLPRSYLCEKNASDEELMASWDVMVSVADVIEAIKAAGGSVAE